MNIAYVVEVLGKGFLPNADAIECGVNITKDLANAFMTTDKHAAVEIARQTTEDGYPAFAREVHYEVKPLA